MGEDIAFEPDPGGARRLDHAVRLAVADSCDSLGRALAAAGVADPALAEAAACLRRGPTRAAVVALYADLAGGVLEDDAERVQSALADLPAALADVSADLRIVTLDEAVLGPGMAARIARHIDDDPAVPVSLQPLTGDALAAARQRAAAALELIAAADPAQAGEIAALVRDLLVVGSSDPDGAFGGASTFYLWGSVTLNASAHPTRLAFAEGLAHETAHMLLLGHARGFPLVDNPASERFTSPLRTDARPMDGIVHATFVLARMHRCMARLLASGLLDDDERATAAANRAAHARLFATGLATITAHARLTPVGARLMAGARAYMAQQDAARCGTQ